MKKINYQDLNSRQQENYNFQKVSAILADYGFSTIRLNDDWQGADFIANHIDGKTFLKVQLKGRFTIDKKYLNKDIYICFIDQKTNDVYLYNHDEIVDKMKSDKFKCVTSSSWIDRGGYSMGLISKSLKELLKEYKL